jgi:peroxiredoxin Q/BCP
MCKSLRESGDEIRKFDVAHFAASVDASDTNRQFAQTIGADYPVLSDPDRQVATAYGVIGPGMPGALRWTFYIARDGRILHVDKQINTSTHGRDVARRLAELGIARRTVKR